MAALTIIETLISRLRMTCNVEPKAPEKLINDYDKGFN